MPRQHSNELAANCLENMSLTFIAAFCAELEREKELELEGEQQF